MLDQILIVVGILGLIIFSIGAVYLNIEKQRRVNNEKRI
jgi:hypothetical protein